MGATEHPKSKVKIGEPLVDDGGADKVPVIDKPLRLLLEDLLLTGRIIIRHLEEINNEKFSSSDIGDILKD